MNTKPIFEHDCDKCTFLGHVNIDNIPADCYFCDGSLIWRHSNKGSDYGSMPINYVTPLSPFSMVCLSLYIKNKNFNASNFIKISVENTKNGEILNLN